MEITKADQNKAKRMKTFEDNLRDLWGSIKHTNIRIIGVPEEEEKKKGSGKLFEGIIDLNDTLNRMDLIDVYRTFHPKTAEYTFFSSAHGTFSRVDHILGHKSNLGKFKKIEIVSSIFSDHSAMRLDINYMKKSVKNTKAWGLKKYTTK